MEFIKFSAVGIICAVLAVIVKQYRPDIAPLVQMAGVAVLAVTAAEYLKKLLDEVSGLLNTTEIINEGYIELLVKVLGIAIVTQIASDICRDSGNSALATNVELVGKVIILALCFSLIKTVAQLAGGLLK